MSDVVMASPAMFISNCVSPACQSQSQMTEAIINSYRLRTKGESVGWNEDSYNS